MTCTPVQSIWGNMARRSLLRRGQAMLERRLLWIREFESISGFGEPRNSWKLRSQLSLNTRSTRALTGVCRPYSPCSAASQISAALQARPQPDRASLRQVEGAAPKACRAPSKVFEPTASAAKIAAKLCSTKALPPATMPRYLTNPFQPGESWCKRDRLRRCARTADRSSAGAWSLNGSAPCSAPAGRCILRLDSWHCGLRNLSKGCPLSITM